MRYEEGVIVKVDTDFVSSIENKSTVFTIRFRHFFQMLRFVICNMCVLQGRMPFMRAMSMEQRWQDLASLLSLPGAPDHFAHPAHPGYPGHGISHSHYEAQRNVLLHNATLAPPVGDLNSTGPYHNVGEYTLH